MTELPPTRSATKLCSRCEQLPDHHPGRGRLYLWFPLGHSLAKISERLSGETSQGFRPLGPGQCVVEGGDGESHRRLVTLLGELLTAQEVADTKVLFVEGEREPAFTDFARVRSLRQFAALADNGWLVEMLRDERLTSHFQPIVLAADPARVFAHEALMRGVGVDGGLIAPGRILDLCRDADLLFQVDLLARRTAVREAGRHRLASRLFINFNPTAIYDPAFCLRSTVRAIDEAGLPPQNVVFEVTESDRSADTHHLRRILEYYRGAGFGVALDDLGSGYSSLNLVHQLRPDYVKLDMELIRGVHEDECKAVIAEKTLEIAQRLGIKTVAEGVETAGELEWVRSRGADYVQGYLIAKPSATPLDTIPAFAAPSSRSGRSASISLCTSSRT